VYSTRVTYIYTGVTSTVSVCHTRLGTGQAPEPLEYGSLQQNMNYPGSF